MTVKTLRSKIAERNKKLKAMKSSGIYADEFVQQFEQASLAEIRKSYLDSVDRAIKTDKDSLALIKTRYEKERPTVSVEGNRLALLQNKVGAMSDNQLVFFGIEQSNADSPDALTLRAVSQEMRQRGQLKDEADRIANFVSAAHLDTPYEGDAAYRLLEKRINQWQVLENQAKEGNMLVLADDPTEVSNEDIIMMSKIDEVV